MAVKIRLLRMGKIRNPQYRIVVADSRTKRDGRAIEYVGIYQPKENPSLIQVKSERVQYWLSVGAQPSEAVQRILEKTGDWQQFKGLPAPPPLLVAEPKKSRTEVYEAESKAAAGVADTKPATPKKSARTEPKQAAAPEAAEAKPAETKAVDPAEPNREAVAETAAEPAGAGAATTEGTTDAGAGAS
ncbi:30S ribosomal protein S16 [Actinoplanes subtropicus]|uniref:30S ribosomal protein S16 n=1 Tax=Actinoplanes subtropicus TaxID=543632 RepID=UPI00068F960A|nr:30S ribosomal protein S16 [Actinoplanes subtropicus]